MGIFSKINIISVDDLKYSKKYRPKALKINDWKRDIYCMNTEGEAGNIVKKPTAHLQVMVR
jgi:hypothetical protein